MSGIGLRCGDGSAQRTRCRHAERAVPGHELQHHVCWSARGILLRAQARPPRPLLFRYADRSPLGQEGQFPVMSARHRQAERRRREAKLLTEALLREAGSVAAAVIDAKLPAPTIDELIARSSLGTPGAVALRATAEPEAVRRTLERADLLARKGSSRS